MKNPDNEATGVPPYQPEDYDKLSDEQKATLLRWIEETYAASYNAHDLTSSDLMQGFERSPGGFQITPGQFKGAMLATGHHPLNEGDQDGQFHTGPHKAGHKAESFHPHAPDRASTHTHNRLDTGKYE